MKHLKITALALIALTAIVALQAGIFGFLTENKATWDFVNKTGGIRLDGVQDTKMGPALFVVYDVTGMTHVTHKPEMMNSGMMVQRVAAKVDGHNIRLTVYTSVIEKGTQLKTSHACLLPELEAGKYQVYYGDVMRPETKVGTIEINQ
ncbi:hypothetical protein [Cerasicoccus arenae]|uniref:Uncharacterized protein n=1 Tax=Cerasicoccus arenae TaxID=424488 RepID=A0A8J3DEX8_9BACT|nr:hypothetical protein [Cerasicoccus arenae]MBK1857821.1 hypothetical protein [Cerasicoccus arenae]GHC11680.1 hypothetical protein GCM10007047_31220 [Cerasicoccus arenae]